MQAGEPQDPTPAAAAPRSEPKKRYVLMAQDPVAAGELGRTLRVAPSLAQVLLNRGLGDVARAQHFLGPRLSHLTSPDSMRDRSVAARRLATAVRKRERVVVFGDYDVDGTTSCAILSDILESLGGDVRSLVANRFQGGYGFSEPALARAFELAPRVIVTCDCGSSDHDRIETAHAAGVDVIVVDHHLVPAKALPALAFLNPHRPDCGFPYKGLCSAGLALSLGAAVRAELGVNLDLRAWLDLVALGTVADVAPLDGDNRCLVRAGLLRLASPEARPGVRALREAARIRDGQPVGGVDVSFRLAPRLNAAGRLGDPQITLDLLRARTLEEARLIAARIERINAERKEVERLATTAALAQARTLLEEVPDTAGLVVAGEGWHRGVVGISAARLVDALQRPTLVLGTEDGVAHGSGRAPDGFPLFDALSRCGGLLDRFGGHHAAVGLSLPASRVDELRVAFRAACAEVEVEAVAEPQVNVDVLIDSNSGELPTAAELACLEPLGEGNPEPLFQLEGARVRSSERVGDGHLKLQLDVLGRRLSAFGFELAGRAPAVGSRLRVWGALRPDGFRGGQAIEMRLLDFEIAD